MKEYQDLSYVPDSAYRLAELIDGEHYNNIIVYEFHEPINPASAFNSESGVESFRERNLEFYQNFITPLLIDNFPAIIHIAIKISSIWFFAEDCGSNYYLGFGPTGIIHLRDACHKKGVKIFVINEPFKDWKKGFLGINNVSPTEKQIRTVKNKKNPIKITSKITTDSSEPKDRKQFEKTIKSIQYLTTSMQERPQEYKGLKEENIRDKMVIPLNVIFEGRVNGEAKSCKGKTDIKITTKDGRNNHIFELKVWDGTKSLQEAITQLQGYLSWHYNYAGVIMFCYEMEFTALLNKAKNLLIEKYKYIPSRGYDKNEFRFSLPLLTDKKKLIQTHLTLINLRTN